MKILIAILGVVVIIGLFFLLFFKLDDLNEYIDSSDLLKCGRIHGEYGHSGKHAMVLTFSLFGPIILLIASIAALFYKLFDK